MEEKPDAIMWGWGQPTRQRSQEHREYLIAQYNKDKPKDKHVSTMEELEERLKMEKQTK